MADALDPDLGLVLNHEIEAAAIVGVLDAVELDADVIVEMGPVRPAKTMVRAFAVDAECAHISALLVNDVVACTPSATRSSFIATSAAEEKRQIAGAFTRAYL